MLHWSGDGAAHRQHVALRRAHPRWLADAGAGNARSVQGALQVAGAARGDGSPSPGADARQREGKQQQH